MRINEIVFLTSFGVQPFCSICVTSDSKDNLQQKVENRIKWKFSEDVHLFNDHQHMTTSSHIHLGQLTPSRILLQELASFDKLTFFWKDCKPHTLCLAPH